MAKRRRKRTGLGMTSKGHGRALDGALQIARVAGERAAKALKQGRCSQAGKELFGAAALWGRYNVHRQQSGSTATGENAASNRYAEIKDDFFSACVRPKG